ncbi:MAG: hypothetical protein IJ189_06985 [Clostridia bacterium]|nr:hypothetical protein [Clostridia bacterium]
MMYRDSSFKVHMNNGNLRLQRRVLVLVCAVLLAAVIMLGVTAIRSSAYKNQANNQIKQRMISAAASAIDEVNRMNSIVTSNTPSRLAKVRQYVYLMEQLNNLNMAVNGGESGRLAYEDAFTALFADLDALDVVIQAAKSSTLDGRTALLAHLVMLQNDLAGQ